MHTHQYPQTEGCRRDTLIRFSLWVVSERKTYRKQFIWEVFIERGKGRRDEKVKVFKGALLNWSHCGQLRVSLLVHRRLRMISSKTGMGIHLTIDFYIPQLVCRHHVCYQFTLVSEKFWGIDEKLPAGPQTWPMEPNCGIKAAHSDHDWHSCKQRWSRASARPCKRDIRCRR